MSRLQSFLPELSAANETLLERLKVCDVNIVSTVRLGIRMAWHLMYVLCAVERHVEVVCTGDAPDKRSTERETLAVPRLKEPRLWTSNTFQRKVQRT
jgi:hypothetical protein